MKGIIYYTHNQLRTNRRDELFSVVQSLILKSGLPITSCSLEPIDFGKNVVLKAKKGPVTMFRQILMALENSNEKYVFFCEHDVLYHQSHFDFTPERDDTFYYNNNVWRWHFLKEKVITFDELSSVSGICVNREFAIDFYKKRLDFIYKNGFDKVETYGNPHWARDMGYEPGKHGEVRTETWKSEYPNIDVRHQKNMTPDKITVGSFKRKPHNWQESTIDKVPGWDIKTLFP